MNFKIALTLQIKQNGKFIDSFGLFIRVLLALKLIFKTSYLNYEIKYYGISEEILQNT
jgi:hypothetical protein